MYLPAASRWSVMATLYGLAIKARDGASRATLRKIVEQTMRTWPRRELTTNGVAERESVNSH
jgi:hypothetical protein